MRSDEKTLFRGLIGGGRAGAAAAATGRQMSANIAVQLAGKAISLAVALITVPVMARSLAPAGFGNLTAGLAYVGIFAAFTTLGTTASAVQRMASDPARESEWLGALVAVRLALSTVVSIACLLGIPVLLRSESEAQLVALVLTPTILLGVAGSQMAVFQTRLRAAIPQLLAVVQSVLWLVTVLALGALGRGAVYFAAGYLFVVAVLAVMQVLATRKLVGMTWGTSWSLWRPLLRMALPLGIASVMISIYFRIDAVLLVELSGAHEAGIYAVAYRFLDPLIMLPATVMATFFPVLSAVYSTDRARARRLVQRCAELVFVITLPIFVGTLALSDQIVGLLFGPDYARSAGVLAVLMAALVSIGFGTLAGLLATVLGLQWRLALYSTIGAVANVAVNLVLIPLYGAYGAAVTTVVTEVLTMTLMFATALRAMEMRLELRRFFGACAAGTVMWGVAVALRPVGVVLALAGSTLVYTAILLLLGVVRIDDVRALRTQS
jgi:O-antigen/teichoic acid export membrane protein